MATGQPLAHLNIWPELTLSCVSAAAKWANIAPLRSLSFYKTNIAPPLQQRLQIIIR